MQRKHFCQMLLNLGLAAATGFSGGMAFADGDKVTVIKEQSVTEQPLPLTPNTTPPSNTLNDRTLLSLTKVPDYWIGVQGGEIQPPLQTHLGLEENEGVLVEWVAPESPADKAGVKQYDVILKVNDTPVSNVGDIVKKVDEIKDKELTLAIIRKSEPKELKLTPEKRPDNAKASGLPQQRQRSFNSVHPGVIIERFDPFERNGKLPDNLPEEFRQMIEQMQKQTPQIAAPNPFRGRFADLFRFNPETSNTTTMQISIEPDAQNGDGGTLTVKKNGQTWSTSQFSDLPKNVQKDVAEILKNSVDEKNVGDWISEQMKSGRRLTFSVTISGNASSEGNQDKPENKKSEETTVKPET
ncbi:MAG: PDZ domain-containing protein [Planctomycetaceae bacterium]|nr:PDZ domain-containing protein [Planctomycetaceae bacterium]